MTPYTAWRPYSQISAFGLGVSVFSHLIWGTYPVFARYIGARVAGKPSNVAVLSCLTALDTLVLLLIAALIRRACYRLGIPDPVLAPTLPEKKDLPRLKLKQGLSYGALCLFRMLTNMQSARMTYAFNIQMMALMLPFFVAVLARLLLGEHIERALLPPCSSRSSGSAPCRCCARRAWMSPGWG